MDISNVISISSSRQICSPPPLCRLNPGHFDVYDKPFIFHWGQGLARLLRLTWNSLGSQVGLELIILPQPSEQLGLQSHISLDVFT